MVVRVWKKVRNKGVYECRPMEWPIYQENLGWFGWFVKYGVLAP
jgi:hypothetical protein